MRGEQQQLENEHEQVEIKHDAAEVPSPQIYVASLSDYNAGHLHGTWIDAAQDYERIDSEIYDMLCRSQEPGAEEIAIHDYSGFGAFQPNEYDSIETVNRIAQGIEEHGQPYAHWVSHVGTQDEEALHEFEDHYLGRWDSLADYAVQVLDDLGVDLAKLLPDWLQTYVNVDHRALGRDMGMELYVSEAADGTYLFQP